MAQKNGWIFDASGVRHNVQKIYRMSETGWSGEIADAYVQNYQYSPTHPNIDWRRWHDTNANVTPPTLAPTNVALANAHLYVTNLSWQLTGNFDVHINYVVCTSAGVEVDSGLSNRFVTKTGSPLSDSQTWDSTMADNGWYVKAQVQQFNAGGSGPWSAFTAPVKIIP